MQQAIESKTLSEIVKITEQYDFVIIDSKVDELYFTEQASLQNKITIRDPESKKNFGGYQSLSNSLLDKNIKRNSKVIIIGGGALSDLAAFTCSTVCRGVQFDIIPTTLLSMIDAAIGGKCGINTVHGKNQVGLFSLAQRVYICEQFLSTLSEVEIHSGKGELSKYGLLDQAIYESIFKDDLSSLILKCANLKSKIVAEDLKDSSARVVLNLGHTFGHAFELIEKTPHGIAVAQGIMAILSLHSPELISSYQEILDKLELKIGLPKGPVKELIKMISYDKKSLASGSVSLVIPSEIGKMLIVEKTLNTLSEDIESNEYFKYFN